MRLILKLIFFAILFIVLFLVTIIPKLLSAIWYNKFRLNYPHQNYFQAIDDLIFTIIEHEE